jgi:hypothetical protein
MNKSRETMPTIRFSISCPLHFLAEADIGRADYEESDDDTDVNEICHNYVLLSTTQKPATAPGCGIIKRRAVDVKNVSMTSARCLLETLVVKRFFQPVWD